jgi:hypothetical protein
MNHPATDPPAQIACRRIVDQQDGSVNDREISVDGSSAHILETMEQKRNIQSSSREPLQERRDYERIMQITREGSRNLNKSHKMTQANWKEYVLNSATNPSDRR